MDAGDDAGVAGDFTVPSACVGVVAKDGLVGELFLKLWHELFCGGVVVALFADVGVGARFGCEVSRAVAVGDTGFEHFTVQPFDSIRDYWPVTDDQR